jgi:hypothetical protein
LANRLVKEVLGRSLDELQPQTRRLLLLIEAKVRQECERLQVERRDFFFSRRDVRGWTAWGNTVLKKHLARLEEMEYLLVHRGGRGQSFVYELLFERAEEDGGVALPGLIEIGKLRYDGNRSRLDEEKSPTGRVQVAGWSRSRNAREYWRKWHFREKAAKQHGYGSGGGCRGRSGRHKTIAWPASAHASHPTSPSRRSPPARCVRHWKSTWFGCRRRTSARTL